MKKSVVDLSDLQEIAPFFKTKFGIFLGKKILQMHGN